MPTPSPAPPAVVVVVTALPAPEALRLNDDDGVIVEAANAALDRERSRTSLDRRSPLAPGVTIELAANEDVTEDDSWWEAGEAAADAVLVGLCKLLLVETVEAAAATGGAADSDAVNDMIN